MAETLGSNPVGDANSLYVSCTFGWVAHPGLLIE